jgi:isoquinoline 1-oxidoreductase subunit beta
VTTLALTIGFEWLGPARRAAAAGAVPGAFAPNAFLRIGADGSVTVISKHLEMGQGSYTGIATVLAEELDADWTRVRVESAPADVKRYANLAFGMQGTGGSSAMANSWAQLRDAGAKGRAMLLSGGGKEWNVPVAELTTDKGVVYHAASKREASLARWSAGPRLCRCPTR